jgi:hypothetical protein
MKSSTNQAGKGDKPRPVNKSKYDQNFDLIFNKKLNKKAREANVIVKKNKTTYKY